MALLDAIAAPRQSVAYLFPEFSGTTNQAGKGNGSGGFTAGANTNDVFVFQFWPSQVTDSYTPNYSTKQIPGASHPLFQYIGGSGRNISFTANFVAEIREQEVGNNVPFNQRIQDASAGSPTNVEITTARLGAGMLPSSRYRVNVSAALAALQQYLYPTYGDQTAGKGVTRPPKKLVLVLPGTKLGRAKDQDGILCIMKAANVTMESWFPSGELRSASVSLQFAEIVQLTSSQGTNVRYIGAEAYSALARDYQISAHSPTDLSL
jgi:hypothetical protein